MGRAESPPSEDLISVLTASAPRATEGSRTQLSWATTPEKRIWPGQRASDAAARTRTQKGSTLRQMRKGKTGKSPQANAVARRAMVVGGTPAAIRNKPQRTSGRPTLKDSQSQGTVWLMSPWSRR